MEKGHSTNKSPIITAKDYEGPYSKYVCPSILVDAKRSLSPVIHDLINFDTHPEVIEKVRSFVSCSPAAMYSCSSAEMYNWFKTVRKAWLKTPPHLPDEAAGLVWTTYHSELRTRTPTLTLHVDVIKQFLLFYELPLSGPAFCDVPPYDSISFSLAESLRKMVHDEAKRKYKLAKRKSKAKRKSGFSREEAPAISLKGVHSFDHNKMGSSITTSEIIKKLNLEPNPAGEFYTETLRDVYFLLPSGDVSNLHRISSAETWHFYLGEPITILEINDKDGVVKFTCMGQDIRKSQQLQYTVPPDVWFGAFPTRDYEISPEYQVVKNAPRNTEKHFSLVGKTIVSAFESEDFVLAKRSQLVSCFPALESLISMITPSD